MASLADRVRVRGASAGTGEPLAGSWMPGALASGRGRTSRKMINTVIKIAVVNSAVLNSAWTGG